MVKTTALSAALFVALFPNVLARQSAPAAQIQPGVALPPALARVLADYEKSWSNKQAAALAQLFVEDGFVLSPGHSMVHGRAAIERFYAGSGGPLSLRAVAFAAEGNIGYIIGAYGPLAGAPDDGKFTLTLRRQNNGKWLIVSDMDNGNRPRNQ